MRSAELSRLYPQVAPDDDVTNWPDGRIWEALSTRTKPACPGLDRFRRSGGL